MSSVTARLENWVQSPIGPKGFIIYGEIHDDVQNRWDNGTEIHTSRIKPREIKEGDIVETMNSTYLLGKVRNVKDFSR